MKQKLRLSIDPGCQESQTIKVNPEEPYFGIKRAIVKGDGVEDTSENIFFNLNASVIKRSSQNKSGKPKDIEKKPIGFWQNLDERLADDYHEKHFEVPYKEPILLNDDPVSDELLIQIENNNQDSLELTLELLTQNPFLDLSSPIKSFFEHLQAPGNVKILFSAPFGHGKTTFLKWFFEEQHNDKFGTFHLHPVHYSVASNEDIFRYIKTELLFQLLERDVDFEKEDFSVTETMSFFLSQNPYKIFSSFIKDLSKIGDSPVTIAPHLLKIIDKLRKHHEDIQIDEKEEATEFLRKIYNTEGSIYDDNFYTQLIRQLIEQLNVQGKQTVLVLDDLDRMDPEHIFRILNVFGAHFDVSESETSGNKFNFKKVILVGDVDNLQNIYQHKFGEHTNFRGYISKFYSKSIFEFDNQEAITEYINKELAPDQNIEGNLKLAMFRFLLNDFNKANALTLREALNLSSRVSMENLINFHQQLWLDTILYHLYVLSHEFNYIELVRKLQMVLDYGREASDFPDYDVLTKMALIPLHFNDLSIVRTNITFKRATFELGMKKGRENMLISDSDNTVQFGKPDFYEALIEGAKTYRKDLV